MVVMAEQKRVSNEKEDFVARLSNSRSSFQKATTVNDVLDVVTGSQSGFLWPNYQHYTTISRLQPKLEGRWYLSRGDSTRLNDLQECMKFGNPEVMSHVWETCFSAATSESAAMWAMYCKQSPFAVRITLPNSVMVMWLSRLSRGASCRTYAHSKKMQKRRFSKRLVNTSSSGLYDLIYAATGFVQHKADGLDKERRNALCWNQSFANVADVRMLLTDERMTGLVKDYEWRQEQETRLVVRTEKVERADARIYIDVPKCVRAKMHFTLSPWLDRKFESEVVDLISDMLRRQGISPTNKIHRSVLSGALNFE